VQVLKTASSKAKSCPASEPGGLAWLLFPLRRRGLALRLGRVSRNALVLLGGTAFTNLLTIPFLAFLARTLGTDRFGVYSVALAFGNIFVLVIDMGASTLLTREIGGDARRGPRVVGTLLAAKPLILLAALAGSWLLCRMLDYSAAERTAIQLAIGVAAMMALALEARGVFHAYGRMEYDLVGQLAERGLTIAGAVFAISWGYGVPGVLVAALAGNVSDAALGWLLVRRTFVRGRFRIDYAHYARYWRDSLSICVAAVLYALYVRAPVIAIGRLLGNSAAGWYNAALQVVGVTWWLRGAVGAAALAPLAGLASTNREAFRYSYRRWTLMMLCIGVALAALVALAARWAIPLLYTQSFAPSVQVLRILALGLPLTFSSSILLQVLLATNHQLVAVRAMVIALAVYVALVLLLRTTAMLNIGTIAGASVGTELILLGQYAFSVWRREREGWLVDGSP